MNFAPWRIALGSHNGSHQRALAAGLWIVLAFLVSSELCAKASGAALWLVFSLKIASALLMLSWAISLCSWPARLQPAARFLRTNAILLIASFAFCAVLAELSIPLLSGLLGIPVISSDPPPELAKRDVSIPGANAAYYLNGILHVHDENHFRHIGPWPEKSAGVLRIVVIGDSLTYGQAVEEEKTYARVLERELRRDAPVEVLNLGVQGYQSIDILRTLIRMQPILKPDLVLYGVCLNDFLPQQVGEYSENLFSFPLPESMKSMFLKRSLLGPALDRGYGKLLLSLHLRNDFNADILEDFSNYQAAFGSHVSKMNSFLLGNGLPALVAQVFDNHPEIGSPRYRIAAIAERLLRKAEAEIIPIESFYQRYSGRDFSASPWDGHPSAEAHQIFAERFAEKVRSLPVFAKFANRTES